MASRKCAYYERAQYFKFATLAFVVVVRVSIKLALVVAVVVLGNVVNVVFSEVVVSSLSFGSISNLSSKMGTASDL